jgi:hypothetical protein
VPIELGKIIPYIPNQFQTLIEHPSNDSFIKELSKSWDYDLLSKGDDPSLLFNYPAIVFTDKITISEITKWFKQRHNKTFLKRVNERYSSSHDIAVDIKLSNIEITKLVLKLNHDSNITSWVAFEEEIAKIVEKAIEDDQGEFLGIDHLLNYFDDKSPDAESIREAFKSTITILQKISSHSGN